MADNLNLTPERGPNIWEDPPKRGEQRRSVAAAVLLAAGALSAFAGGMMLYRAMRLERERPARRAEARRLSDLVSAESEESFPASDAPSWTPAAGATLDLPRGI